MNKYGSRWLPAWRRLAIYIRDGFTCLYCGTDLRDRPAADVTLDHLLPRSAGGIHHETNLITACRRCNSARQDKAWTDYATGGAVDRILAQRQRPLNRDLARAILADRAGDPAVEAARS